MDLSQFMVLLECLLLVCLPQECQQLLMEVAILPNQAPTVQLQVAMVHQAPIHLLLMVVNQVGLLSHLRMVSPQVAGVACLLQVAILLLLLGIILEPHPLVIVLATPQDQATTTLVD